jgi:hypothetical protein
MTELVARLKMYLDYKNLGIIDLSIILGYSSPQKLYRLFNTENANPSCQIIEDISNKFYDLNLNWLFTGRGEMVYRQNDNVDYKEKYFSCLIEKDALYRKLLDNK